MSEIERRISVYCASSRKCPGEYNAAARRVGEVLAENGFTIVYGGGASGSKKILEELSDRGCRSGEFGVLTSLEWLQWRGDAAEAVDRHMTLRFAL